jgi:hypothetical protein
MLVAVVCTRACVFLFVPLVMSFRNGTRGDMQSQSALLGGGSSAGGIRNVDAYAPGAVYASSVERRADRGAGGGGGGGFSFGMHYGGGSDAPPEAEEECDVDSGHDAMHARVSARMNAPSQPLSARTEASERVLTPEQVALASRQQGVVLARLRALGLVTTVSPTHAESAAAAAPAPVPSPGSMLQHRKRTFGEIRKPTDADDADTYDAHIDTGECRKRARLMFTAAGGDSGTAGDMTMTTVTAEMMRRTQAARQAEAYNAAGGNELFGVSIFDDSEHDHFCGLCNFGVDTETLAEEAPINTLKAAFVKSFKDLPDTLFVKAVSDFWTEAYGHLHPTKTWSRKSILYHATHMTDTKRANNKMNKMLVRQSLELLASTIRVHDSRTDTDYLNTKNVQPMLMLIKMSMELDRQSLA